MPTEEEAREIAKIAFAAANSFIKDMKAAQPGFFEEEAKNSGFHCTDAMIAQWKCNRPTNRTPEWISSQRERLDCYVASQGVSQLRENALCDEDCAIRLSYATLGIYLIDWLAVWRNKCYVTRLTARGFRAPTPNADQFPQRDEPAAKRVKTEDSVGPPGLAQSSYFDPENEDFWMDPEHEAARLCRILLPEDES